MYLSKFDALTLSQLPTQEDDFLEFKSSKTKPDALKSKLTKAASAFANSGGGIFVAGVDDQTGNADGGFDQTIKKQSVLDWVDNVLSNVQPEIVYKRRLLTEANGRGLIDPGKAVLLLGIEPSSNAPHMAGDNKYYIRSGAHTSPAPAFIVEALFAKRSISYPKLTHVLRRKPSDPGVIQFGLVALNSNPAVNVKFDILNGGGFLERHELPFLLTVVDKQNSFFFDAFVESEYQECITHSTHIKVVYEDLKGNSFHYKSDGNLFQSLPNISFLETRMEKKMSELIRAVKGIGKKSMFE